MASTDSVGNISSAQLEWRAGSHRELPGITRNLFQDGSSSLPADSSDDSMASRFNLAVETSAKKSTSSDCRGEIMCKFSTAASNDNPKNDDQNIVSSEFEEPEEVETWKNKKKKVSDTVNQTLIAKNGNAAESKKKRSFSAFSVSLTREKIEDDLFAMGGSKRSRRVKKRPKNLQRQLDDLFPGLRLKYITTDDYRVRK